MRRDPTLLRLILEEVERKATSDPETISIPGYSAETLDAHIETLSDEHFIEAIVSRDGAGLVVSTFVQRLTEQGQLHLAQLREEASQKHDTDKVAKMLRSVRSHPVLAIFIFVGVIIIALANVKDSICKLAPFLCKSDSQQSSSDKRPEVELNSVAIHAEVLARERGNIERCL